MSCWVSNQIDAENKSYDAWQNAIERAYDAADAAFFNAVATISEGDVKVAIERYVKEGLEANAARKAVQSMLERVKALDTAPEDEDLVEFMTSMSEDWTFDHEDYME